MIKKTIRYFLKYGLIKTLTRSFLEIRRMLDGNSELPNVANNTPVITSESNSAVVSKESEKIHTYQSREGASINILSLFREEVKLMKNPHILELGSRDVMRERLIHEGGQNLPPQYTGFDIPRLFGNDLVYKYTGFDIHNGLNVDVVGDAHELSSFFRGDCFDVVISKAVFEHLAMPWKVVLEINKVLKQNGILYIDTLHTYPLHERPWDFWRFSGEAWKFLLNKWTGFEIIYSTLESPCKIVPETEIPSWLADHEAYLYSKVLARKISHYDKDRCKWEIKIMDVFESNYPRPH